MKPFFKTTAAAVLALAMTSPLASAQTGPNPHPHADDKTKIHNKGNHDKVVNRNTTIAHQTIVNQHPASPFAPNGDFLPGHAPGDNRLPIYAQQHQGYATGGRAWRRGDRYDGPREVVTDYDRYHLNRPPSGYEYVRNGSQFVLIAVASGVVADVLLNALTH
jgi:Ni/Co efflux regulator RcnB